MMEKQITSYEIRLFTQGLKEKLNIDLTEYANAFLRRRLDVFIKKWGISNLDNLLLKFNNNSTLLERFLEFISVETTEMFRDPAFWRTFKRDVIPNLAKKQIIRILVPYITSDDELYTLLILLDQNNLLDKAHITATSPFEVNINRTKQGKYTEKKLATANENYKRFTQNPDTSVNNYFTKQGNVYLFSKNLINRVDFVISDILTNTFNNSNDFDLILFRNRMIYFNLNLQNKILEILFYHLAPKGYLIIGFKENIHNFVFVDRLKQISKEEKIFLKNK